MSRQLREMVVAITGASAGIGRALARRLDDAGARLVLAARRADLLGELNREMNDRHLVVPTDVAETEQCARLIARTVEHFGRIDTLVCNAGYGLALPIAHTSAEQMRRIFQTNVFGTTDCVRAAIPLMQRQPERGRFRGQIVIVSSAAARRGLPYFGPYSATKAAQLSLAEALRVELRPMKIAVTSVHPIGTDSDFFRTAERLSAATMPPRSVVEIHQSADTVARAMVRAIRRPRAELWPFAPTRFALGIAVVFPGLVDRVMARHRRQLAERNPE